MVQGKERPWYRAPSFTRLMAVHGLSQYSEFAYMMAVIWAITSITDSPLYVSGASMCSILPGLVLSLIAGTLVDRWGRRRVIIFANAARALVVAALALLYLGGLVSLWLLLAVTLLMSFLARLYAPAYLALLPSTVARRDLQRANSASLLMLHLAYAAGMYLCALVTDRLGWPAGAAIIATLFAATCPLAAAIPAEAAGDAAAGAAGGASQPHSMLSDIKAALAFVAGQRRIQLYMMLAACSSVFIGTSALLPVYIKTVLGETMLQYGIVEGTSVVGMLGATLLLTRIQVRRIDLVLPCCAAALALCMISLALSTNVYSLVLTRFAVAFFLGSFNVLYVTEFHRLLPPDYRGRVFSLGYIVSTTPHLVATGLAGLAAEYVSISTVWIAAGTLGLALIGAGLLILRRAPAGTPQAPGVSDH